VINPGLLLASLAGLVTLIWLVTASTVASMQFSSARDHGSAPVEALAKADIAALQAHADESLNLIDRGGDASIQQNFISLQKQLGPGPRTLLTEAAATAAGSPGGAPALGATRAAPAWYAVHRKVVSGATGDPSLYIPAVELAVGTGQTQSGGLFKDLDNDLTAAMAADQASFQAAALSGQDALTGLEAGVIVLAIVMAAGCAWGISRRLAEYR
jgi:hypothetical protein